MARQFSLRTGCKINLYLDILAKRKDGYHLLDSVFYPLPRPADSLDVMETPGSELNLKCSPSELENQHNILYKVYNLFARAADFRPGLKIYLHKKVPAGAGLGGGSANAAALFQILNRMAGSRRLDHHSLVSLAAQAGADVPFFFSGRPARVRGIGEIISPLSVDLKGLMMILICPPIHVDTAWAYHQWDESTENLYSRPSHSLTSAPATDKDSPLGEQLVLSNSFEKMIFRSFPEIMRIKTSMLENGATACVMSGSGSSLSAFFRDEACACRSGIMLHRQSIPFYFYKF
ncbi:MAG: 4-(cytidine 5'-diphospho)-2-C-methyl-D-erythritol kinase [Desulfonatronovibrio sp.]